MRRLIPLVAVAILLAGILSDPYTYARDGSDAIRDAPLWQLSFAILDIGLLFAIVAFTLRSKVRGAGVMVAIETAFYLAGNTVLYLRDGAERFLHGIGAESNFADHVVVVVVRLVLLAYLWVLASRGSNTGVGAAGRLTSA